MIWSKRASAAGLLGLCLLAGGCAPQGGEKTASPLPGPSIDSASGQQAKAPAGLGLLPLPSRQQVSASVPLGRLDPFRNPRPIAPAVASGGTPGAAAVAGSAAPSGASASAAAPGSVAGAARPAGLPSGFVFSGVIASRGRIEGLVQLGDQTGTVRVGDVGNPSTPWLPPGWKVAAIDAREGTLTLRNGALLRMKTIND